MLCRDGPGFAAARSGCSLHVGLRNEMEEYSGRWILLFAESEGRSRCNISLKQVV
jgi:hypothetical protein